MQTNKELTIILDFAEGRMTAEEFWEHFKANGDLRKILIEDPNRSPKIWYRPDTMLARGVDPKTYQDSSMLYTMVSVFLTNGKINFTPYTFYDDRYMFLIEMQPEWLDVSSEDFLIDIVSKAPKNMPNEQKINWCKDRLKEMFRYDSVPPIWAQGPEWPFNENGIPLVFKGQSEEDIHSELVKFYFYDSDTGEETIVEQLY